MPSLLHLSPQLLISVSKNNNNNKNPSLTSISEACTRLPWVTNWGQRNHRSHLYHWPMSPGKQHQVPEPHQHQKRTTPQVASCVPCTPKSKAQSSGGIPSHRDPRFTCFSPPCLHLPLHHAHLGTPTTPPPSAAGQPPVIMGKREQDHMRSTQTPAFLYPCRKTPMPSLSPPLPPPSSPCPLPSLPPPTPTPPTTTQAGARTFWRNAGHAQPASQPHPSVLHSNTSFLQLLSVVPRKHDTP